MDNPTFEVNEPKFQVLQVTHQTKIEEIINFLEQRMRNNQETIITVQPDFMPENCAKIVEDLQKEGVDPFTAYMIGLYAKKINSEEMDITEILTKVKSDFISPKTAEVFEGFGDQILMGKVFREIPGDKDISLLLTFATALRHYKNNDIYAANEFRIIALLIGVYNLVNKYSHLKHLISLKVHGVSLENFEILNTNESKISEKINSLVSKMGRIYRPIKPKGVIVNFIQLKKDDYPPRSKEVITTPGKDFMPEIGFLNDPQNQLDFGISQILAARDFTIKDRNLDRAIIIRQVETYARNSLRDVVLLDYIYTNYSTDLSTPVDPINVLFALGRKIANIPNFDELSDKEIFELLKSEDPEFWQKEMIKYFFMNIYLSRYYIVVKNDYSETILNTKGAELLKILGENGEIYQTIITRSGKENLLLVMNELWNDISKQIDL